MRQRENSTWLLRQFAFDPTYMILPPSEASMSTIQKAGMVRSPSKTGDQVDQEFHVASHGYTNGKEDFVLEEVIHTPEKKDSTPRGGAGPGKIVWPPEHLLEEYVDSPAG
ncbi:hypothetical protein VTO42DRAFT_3722 [Malbranchea cinnamomea]